MSVGLNCSTKNWTGNSHIWLNTGVEHAGPLRFVEISMDAVQNTEYPYNMNQQMHYFLLFYLNSKPLHVSSRFAAHHQEDQLCINTNWYNLMFFRPCIINWLYINYQLDALIIIYSQNSILL